MIYETRDALYAALAAAGLEVAKSGGQRAVIPGVIVAAGEPWIESAGVIGSRQRVTWRVQPIAGKIDAEATHQMLGELIERTWAALQPLYGAGGWTVPTINMRIFTDLTPDPQLGAVMAVSTLISLSTEVP